MTIYGYPIRKASWCKKLKTEYTDIHKSLGIGVQASLNTRQYNAFSDVRQGEARKPNIVHYIGIAADEPLRIEKHIGKKDKVLPLVQIGWDEDLCGLEATYMDMLSPTYTCSMRDGCWFCHNQGIAQLRNLRNNYPDLWERLLKIDVDSPITFKPDGHTVRDFDERFALEDAHIVPTDRTFKWAMCDCDRQISLF